MLVALAASGGAQGLPPARIFKQNPKVVIQEQRQLERLSKMNPEQRKKALNNFPPQRRALLEQRLERYERMTPEERRRINQQVEQFQQMPEDRRAKVRQLYEKFETFAQDRKPFLRQELQRLRTMEPARREFRMGNPRFRAMFSESEREWLGAMVEALPSGPE